MLTKKQKAQIRLLLRQHAKMEAEGMMVRSYHAFHGMNAFVSGEWDFAAEEDAIPEVFGKKFTRLTDQHSETCWSDSPIGPFGLMGEVEGLRSPIDLYSRPITGCDPRIDGLRTVKPSRLNLALEVIKGTRNSFGHSEILVRESQNIKFWVKEGVKSFYDSIDFINKVIEDDKVEEDTIKAIAFRCLLDDLDCDDSVIQEVIAEAQNNDLEVVIIDDDGEVIASPITSIEAVEGYLTGYYRPATIEEKVEEVKWEFFQEFLEDGSNEEFVSLCCPTWVVKEAEAICRQLKEYEEEAYWDDAPYERTILEAYSRRIDNLIDCMKQYAPHAISTVFNAVSKAIDLLNEMVEENEEMEKEGENYLPF